MNVITRDELKVRMEQHEPLQLVMALGRWAYDRLHIPGSQNIDNWLDAAGSLNREQEVVVYCTNPNCPASYRAYYLLKNLGFEHITRFAGGIEDWMEAGLPVEGSLVEEWKYAAA